MRYLRMFSYTLIGCCFSNLVLADDAGIFAGDGQAQLVLSEGGLNKPNPPSETNDKLGGVYVFSPDGKLLTFVHIPRDEVTNCTFGGEDLKALFVTAGGSLWSIRTTTAGQLPWPCR